MTIADDIAAIKAAVLAPQPVSVDLKPALDAISSVGAVVNDIDAKLTLTPAPVPAPAP